VSLLDWLPAPVAVVVGACISAFSLWTAGHALLRKRSPRSAAAWVAFCLLFPLLGASLYWLIGQNRIFRRARKLRERFPWPEQLDQEALVTAELLRPLAADDRELEAWLQVARTGDAATGRPLRPGNRIFPLEDGEQTYPPMLEAIEAARESIDLSTYLFDGARTVERFVDALARARERGVRVRVMIDGLGDLLAWNVASRALARRGIRAALFLPPSLSERGLHINLRNHRKLLIVDGRRGFTGGINLRDSHEVTLQPTGAWRTRDLHFELAGPAVGDLERVFQEDWCFATGEPFVEPLPRFEPEAGEARVRVVPDGPDEERDALKWLIIGAIASARRRIRIETPYFIPPHELEAALIAARLRGVRVEVLLPGTIDHRFVHWAARAMVGDLVRRGVELRYQPAPFVHTKLMLIDDGLAIVGSANLDPRSLRLNFELDLAVYDRDFSHALHEMFDRDWRQSRPLTATMLARDPLWRRLRDNLARLAAPYL
jgi:cardiolipin synthase